MACLLAILWFTYWTESSLYWTMANIHPGGCYCEYHPGVISFNTLRPRQNGRHFADNIFKCIFLNENVWIIIEISLKFVPSGPINNIPALVQIMAWCCPGNMPLSKPMVVSLLTHICVTQPQWVQAGHCNSLKIEYVDGIYEYVDEIYGGALYFQKSCRDSSSNGL